MKKSYVFGIIILVVLLILILGNKQKNNSETNIVNENTIQIQGTEEKAESWREVIINEQRSLRADANGDIVAIIDGQETIIYSIPGIDENEGTELFGIIKDPNYEENNYVYLTHSYKDVDGNVSLRYVCYTDTGETFINEVLLFETFDINPENPGGILVHGTDDKVYMSVEFDTQKSYVYRMNMDGTLPDDNPISDSFWLPKTFKRISSIFIDGKELVIVDSDYEFVFDLQS